MFREHDELGKEETREEERTDVQYFENWIQQWVTLKQMKNPWQSKRSRLWYWSDYNRSAKEPIQTNQSDISYCYLQCSWSELTTVLGHLSSCISWAHAERCCWILTGSRFNSSPLGRLDQQLTMNRPHLVWIVPRNAMVTGPVQISPQLNQRETIVCLSKLMDMEEGQDLKPVKPAALVRLEISGLLWWKQSCQPAQKWFSQANN